MNTVAAAIAALMLLAAPAAAQEPAAISLTFEPRADSGGAIMVALFDSEAAYDGGAPARSARLDVSAGQLTVTFEGLPAGDYAMRAFHDLNGDGRMNANPFGMPTEPYAFSNNAVGNMGPARWDRARFAVQVATTQTIAIR